MKLKLLFFFIFFFIIKVSFSQDYIDYEHNDIKKILINKKYTDISETIIIDENPLRLLIAKKYDMTFIYYFQNNALNICDMISVVFNTDKLYFFKIGLEADGFIKIDENIYTHYQKERFVSFKIENNFVEMIIKK